MILPEIINNNSTGLTADGTNTIQSEFNSLFLAAGITNSSDLTGGQNIDYTPDGYYMMNTSPYYFVRTGYVDSTTLSNFSSYGDCWSSTAVRSSLAYDLGFGSGALYPANQLSRTSGRSLRCVARSCEK